MHQNNNGLALLGTEIIEYGRDYAITAYHILLAVLHGISNYSMTWTDLSQKIAGCQFCHDIADSGGPRLVVASGRNETYSIAIKPYSKQQNTYLPIYKVSTITIQTHI